MTWTSVRYWWLFISCSHTSTHKHTNAYKSGGRVSATTIITLPARIRSKSKQLPFKMPKVKSMFNKLQVKDNKKFRWLGCSLFCFFRSALCFLPLLSFIRFSRTLFLSPSVPRHSHSAPTPSVLSLFSFISVSNSLFCAAGLEMFELNGCLRCRRNGIWMTPRTPHLS